MGGLVSLRSYEDGEPLSADVVFADAFLNAAGDLMRSRSEE